MATNQVLEVLRGFRQYLTEENKRLGELQDKENINLAAVEITKRFSEIGDTASESDIRKIMFTAVRDASVAGVLPQVQGMISSFSNSAIENAKGKMEERFVMNLTGDKSYEGTGSNAAEYMKIKEDYNNPLQYDQTTYNPETGAQESYLMLVDPHTFQEKAKLFKGRGQTFGERMEEFTSKQRAELRYSSGGSSGQLKKVGWLPGGGAVWQKGNELWTTDPTTGQITAPYDPNIHGQISNSPNAEFTAEKIEQTNLAKAWESASQTLNQMSLEALLDAKNKGKNVNLSNYIDSNTKKWNADVTPWDVLQGQASELGIDLTPYQGLEKRATFAKSKYNEYIDNMAYSEQLNTAGLTLFDFEQLSTGVENVLDESGPNTDTIKRMLSDIYFGKNRFQGLNKDWQLQTSPSWWKKLPKDKKVNIIIDLYNKGLQLETNEKNKKKKEK